jgi:hypothetical protein
MTKIKVEQAKKHIEIQLSNNGPTMSNRLCKIVCKNVTCGKDTFYQAIREMSPNRINVIRIPKKNLDSKKFGIAYELISIKEVIYNFGNLLELRLEEIESKISNYETAGLDEESTITVCTILLMELQFPLTLMHSLLITGQARKSRKIREIHSNLIDLHYRINQMISKLPNNDTIRGKILLKLEEKEITATKNLYQTLAQL